MSLLSRQARRSTASGAEPRPSSTISCSRASPAPAAQRAPSSCATSGPLVCQQAFDRPSGAAARRPRSPGLLMAGHRAREPRPTARERGRAPPRSPASSARKRRTRAPGASSATSGLSPRRSASTPAKPGLRKALTRPEGLSALIVQQAFGLSLRQALSPSKLRAALALVALERAFGDNVQGGLRKSSARSRPRPAACSPANCCRARASSPPTPRLIAALSAEQVGAARPEIEMLRLALAAPAGRRAPSRASRSCREVGRAPSAPPRERRVRNSEAPQRPGLAQFSAGVLTAARSRAEGWPGSRKAFISRVWEAIRTSHPEWGLSEIEFKDMLAGAHRAGQLVLTSADLKNKQNIKEFEDSAILYKNTVWHFVRVED